MDRRTAGISLQSVCPWKGTEVHWRIIANLGFKFRSTLLRIAAAMLLAGAVLLAGESSRAMLASA